MRDELGRVRGWVAPATAIHPLEKFIVPAELDGTRGLYRRPQAQCLLKATNDYQAILAWLRSKIQVHLDSTMADHGSRRVLARTGLWTTPMRVGFIDDRSRLVCHLQWYLIKFDRRTIELMRFRIIVTTWRRAIRTSRAP